MDRIVTGQLPFHHPAARAVHDNRHLQALIAQPHTHLADAAEFRKLAECQVEGFAYPFIGIDLQPIVGTWRWPRASDQPAAGWSRWSSRGCADVDDLQQIAPLLGRQRGAPPVVEDQELDARQVLEQPTVTTIAASQRQGIEQPWHTLIEDGSI